MCVRPSRDMDEIKPICGWDLSGMFMRSIRVADAIYSSCGWDFDKWAWDLQPSVDEIWTSCGWDLAQCLDLLYVTAKVAAFLGSIPTSSDRVESEGRQMKQCLKKYTKNPRKIPQNPLYFIFFYGYFTCMVEARRCDLGWECNCMYACMCESRQYRTVYSRT